MKKVFVVVVDDKYFSIIMIKNISNTYRRMVHSYNSTKFNQKRKKTKQVSNEFD